MDIPELKLTEAFYSLRKVVKELQVQLFDCILMKISLKPAKQRQSGAMQGLPWRQITAPGSPVKAGAFVASQQHLPLIDESFQRIRK